MTLFHEFSHLQMEKQRLEAALAGAERERERYRDQFSWIAREARGDCDPGRILHACNIALDALAAVSPEGEA
jgi:hypothetical protein